MQVAKRHKVAGRRDQLQERAGDLRCEFLGLKKARNGEQAEHHDHGLVMSCPK
jgi:hypothetical protein